MKIQNPTGKSYLYQKGIGFIEILIAALIISLAVLGLGQMLSSSSESATNSKAHSEALVLAERQLEQLRNYATYTEYTTSVVDVTATDVPGTNAVFTPTVTTVASDADPSTYDPVTDPDFRDVEIQVSWASTDGTKTVTLADRIAQEEPVEAGTKLLSLANGDKPNIHLSDPVIPEVPDEEEEEEDTDTPTTPCDGCEDISDDVTEEGDLADATGIYVFGAIDTSHAQESIISVTAFGNFDTVANCPPAVSTDNDQGYECQIGHTTSGDELVWSVSISVTATKRFNGARGAKYWCESTNLYALGNLTYAQNYFPIAGRLVVPAVVDCGG